MVEIFGIGILYYRVLAIISDKSDYKLYRLVFSIRNKSIKDILAKILIYNISFKVQIMQVLVCLLIDLSKSLDTFNDSAGKCFVIDFKSKKNIPVYWEDRNSRSEDFEPKDFKSSINISKHKVAIENSTLDHINRKVIESANNQNIFENHIDKPEFKDNKTSKRYKKI